MVKTKSKMFVMVGMKDSRGRIVKNEQYEVCEFVDKILPGVGLSIKTPTLMDVIRGRSTDVVVKNLVRMGGQIKKAIPMNIMALIYSDNFGKKTKAKK